MGHRLYEIIREENVEMPVRDGTILRANIQRPATPGKYPVLLQRAAYGKGWPLPNCVRDGFIVIDQDIRGRYASDGEFVPLFIDRHHEAEDGFDAVAWCAEYEHGNGQVGTFGASYNAWTQWQLAGAQPPALQAMVAGVIAARSTDWEQGGVFRTGRALQWLINALAPDTRRRLGLPPPHKPAEAAALDTSAWRNRWFWFLPLAEIPAEWFGTLHEFYLEWLRNQHVDVWGFMDQHQKVEVPVLNWTGWYDRLIRTIDHTTHIQEVGATAAARQGQRLVIGPWSHGMFGGGSVGGLEFGDHATVEYPLMVHRWFDHHLRGADNGVMDGDPIDLFVMGRNVWRTEPEWPLQRAVETRYHLRSGGRLSLDEPGEEEPDRFTYDPRDPVPTLYGQWTQDEPHDYRSLDHRRDILRYETAPLREAVEVTGELSMVLWAATSGKDTDWIVRLLDIHPDGLSHGLCYGIVRARYRQGFDRVELVEPGEPLRFEIRLNPIGIEFQPGHRIRVDVTSSDFPNFDRNHNTGGDDYFEATLEVAEQMVFHDRERDSYLLLPIVPAG